MLENTIFFSLSFFLLKLSSYLVLFWGLGVVFLSFGVVFLLVGGFCCFFKLVGWVLFGCFYCILLLYLGRGILFCF